MMTNDELAEAIDQAHRLMNATSRSSAAYESLVKHLEDLLRVQHTRAATIHNPT